MIKKTIFIFLFIGSLSAYSQKVNLGLNLGTGISSQSLSSLDSKFTAIDIGLNNPRNCCSFWPQLETVYFFVVDVYFIVTKHTAYFGQMMYVVNSKKLFSVSTFAP